MNKKIFIASLSLAFTLNAMQPSLQQSLQQLDQTLNRLHTQLRSLQLPPASGQQLYTPHVFTKDNRSIAVVGYGSLMKQPKSADGRHSLAINSSFKPVTLSSGKPLRLPIELMRISSAGKPQERVTRVITPNGEKIPAWYAKSSFKKLPEARVNLAQREGAGQNLDKIYYLKKLAPGQQPDPNETPIRSTRGFQITDWVMRNDIPNLLPDELLQAAPKLAKWANRNGFDALIFASFPANATRGQIRKRLRENPTILQNTKNYIKILPQDQLTAFENEILKI